MPRALKSYKPGLKITVKDKMQSGYSYVLEEPVGKHFHPDFKPALTPAQMLKKGVFEGKYLNDCTSEFPKEWFEISKKHRSLKADPTLNAFKIKSRQTLQVWQKKGWIIDPDPRGWFQWYCRYYLGRRIPEVDAQQIKRWKAFTRHLAQVKKNCEPHNLDCRPKQRQALLQWAYDPFI